MKSQTPETTASVYRERSFDETDFDDGDEEELRTSNKNDESSEKK